MGEGWRSRGGAYTRGMAWIYLFLAGVCEVVWAIGLKRSEGFTRPWTSAWTIAVMLISFYLLSIAMKSLPLGPAYAVWTGIGAVGAVVYGMAVLVGSRAAGRIVGMLIILGGITGLV